MASELPDELPDECCAKCRFFSSPDDNRSWCRRYPKSVFIIGEEGDDDYYDPFSGQNWWWPTMYASDWCGEFQPVKAEAK